ncbi:flagellar protein MotY, partial [Vibrio sinaloensis]
MKKRFATGLTLALATIAHNSWAMDVRYVASPQQSQWQMITNTPLECRLVHPIPNYGDAVFSSFASKKINLDFELKMKRPMGKTRDVSLTSMPPAWRPGEGANRITNIRFFQQFDGYVGGQTAWSILSELEKGRYPTFSYQEWQSHD